MSQLSENPFSSQRLLAFENLLKAHENCMEAEIFFKDCEKNYRFALQRERIWDLTNEICKGLTVKDG